MTQNELISQALEFQNKWLKNEANLQDESLIEDTVKMSITEISNETGKRLVEATDRLRLLLGRVNGEDMPNYECKSSVGLLQSELKNSEISYLILQIIEELEELI